MPRKSKQEQQPRQNDDDEEEEEEEEETALKKEEEKSCEEERQAVGDELKLRQALEFRTNEVEMLVKDYETFNGLYENQYQQINSLRHQEKERFVWAEFLKGNKVEDLSCQNLNSILSEYEAGEQFKDDFGKGVKAIQDLKDLMDVLAVQAFDSKKHKMIYEQFRPKIICLIQLIVSRISNSMTYKQCQITNPPVNRQFVASEDAVRYGIHFHSPTTNVVRGEKVDFSKSLGAVLDIPAAFSGKTAVVSIVRYGFDPREDLGPGNESALYNCIEFITTSFKEIFYAKKSVGLH